MITSPFINLQPYVVLQAYSTAAGGASAPHVVTIDYETSLSAGAEAGEVDGTRKVTATLTPGDASVVYVFDKTEVS